MSELKFKAYGELEISEALSDASHVIIEENGDVKRFPANSIGKVKTVNGAEPDENGNVAVEIPVTVPDIQAATVGQTIVVKSVDENGKPTEWEAVDMPSNGVITLYASDEYDCLYTDAECTVEFPWDDALACANNPNVVIVYASRDEYYRPFKVSIEDAWVRFFSVTLDGAEVSCSMLSVFNPDAGPM